MTFVARLHPFLLLAVLIVAMFIAGLFWEAPFHADALGFPRLFGRVWEVAFLPVQFALDRLRAAEVDPTRTVTILVLAGYVGLLVLLDVIVTKAARSMAG